MGGFFGDLYQGALGVSKIKSRPTVSAEQQSLFGPLADYFKGVIGDQNPGVSDFNSLMSGNSPLLTRLLGNQFDSLLGQSLQEFRTKIAPEINNQFANLGGTLSSRRSKVLADTLGNSLTSVGNTVASQMPAYLQLLGTQIGQREQLRLAPINAALGFALAPTYQSMPLNQRGSFWQGQDASQQFLNSGAGVPQFAGSAFGALV